MEHNVLVGGGVAEAMANGLYETKVTKTKFEATDFEEFETSEDSSTVLSNEVTCKVDEIVECETNKSIGGSNTFGTGGTPQRDITLSCPKSRQMNPVKRC